MNVTIAYGTTEGQARKIAEWAAKYVPDRGHAVELYDSADDSESQLDLHAFQAFVIVASVHQEQHQKSSRTSRTRIAKF